MKGLRQNRVGESRVKSRRVKSQESESQESGVGSRRVGESGDRENDLTYEGIAVIILNYLCFFPIVLINIIDTHYLTSYYDSIMIAEKEIYNENNNIKRT